MIKRIKKIGNGNALFLDKALLELVGLEEGADVQISVHSGSIIVTPVEPRRVDEERFQAALDRVVSERREVLKRLAE